MKINKLNFFFTSVIVFFTNLVFSQCPISFPAAIDICLEGINLNNSICFKNSDGNLKILLNGSSLANKELFSFYKNGNFEMGSNTSYNQKLIILGANTPNQTTDFTNNPPNSYRDISYEFAGAGSAKIRSFRGDFWDTYLQFLTNSKNENTNSNDPQVRMQINGNGNVGIGTANPKALLDVNGGARFSNISSNNDFTNLVIVGANNINQPEGNITFVPDYRRDISFEFADAGSAKIRSFRGNNMDTYIQFLTNPYNGSESTARMQIGSNGNIGIGTTDPKALLDVNGNVNISGNFLKLTTPSSSGDAIIQRATEGNLVINSGNPNSNSSESAIYLNYAEAYGAGNNGIKIYDGGTVNHVDLKMITTSTAGSEGTLHINPSGGKVVISNSVIPSTPSGYKLYVTEGILSEKFKAAIASTAQWSDHVFDEKYKLKPLEEVEQYVLVNKHLPNIPSSEEIIEAGGIDLAEMQAKQMEKIEELTLYLIEMKKEIEFLKRKNYELENKIRR